MAFRLTRRRLAATAAVTLAAPAVLRAQPAVVKIGLIHPVMGPLAFGGSQCRLGGVTAVADLNAAGGIKSLGGAKVEALLGDAQGRPEIASSLVDDFAEQKVAGLTGCYASALGIVATQRASQHNIPFSVDSGIADVITDRGLPNVFRFFTKNASVTTDAITCLNDLNTGAGSPVKTAVVVYEDSEFGTSTAKLLAGKLGGIGIEVKELVPHATPTRDFSNIVYRIKAAAPDLVLISNYPNEYHLLLRTIQQQRVPLVAMFSVSGGGFNLPFAKQQPAIAENMIDFNQWYDPHKPEALAFRARIEGSGSVFGWEVMFGYFAVRILADAIERAGSVDPAKVIPAFAASTFSDHFMAFGPTKFEGGQNVGARGVALQIQKSDIQPIWPAAFAGAAPVFPRPKPV